MLSAVRKFLVSVWNAKMPPYRPTLAPPMKDGIREVPEWQKLDWRLIPKWLIMPWTFPTLSWNIPRRDDGRCRRCLVEPAETKQGDCFDCHQVWGW